MNSNGISQRLRRPLGHKLIAALPFVGVHVACLAMIVFPPTPALLGLATTGYVIRMWAITAGYHRYFAHRTYKTSRGFQLVLAVLGGTAMQQGALWWASWHRRHHKYADQPGDPHSPLRDGFWYAHVGWIFDDKGSPDLSNVKDLSTFRELRWLDRHHYVPVAAYALLCFVIAGLPGVVWGFAVSSVVLAHATFAINSLAHRWGSRRFDTPDGSRNNAVLALPTFGEGWHNNHHRYMASARQGFRWYEVDLTYYSLRFLARLGLVWDIREPPREIELHGPARST
ncbi:MAG TPA: acyl-CoA desaturase [Kofleriaceae bacterium]|jgi:stearoyl-CoA desaturase (delta-9 desaturase)|nr:acyl-CoA desaturase [Kofleriaceae bacterium]